MPVSARPYRSGSLPFPGGPRTHLADQAILDAQVILALFAPIDVPRGEVDAVFAAHGATVDEA